VNIPKPNLEKKPTIDSYSEKGKKTVSTTVVLSVHLLRKAILVSTAKESSGNISLYKRILRLSRKSGVFVLVRFSPLLLKYFYIKNICFQLKCLMSGELSSTKD
jgi:hypothetical protein